MNYNEEEAEEVIRVVHRLLNEIKQRNTHTLVTIFFVISFHESIIAKKSILKHARPRARVAEAAELGIFK